VTRKYRKNGHKMTIGTDFDQFCAACELIFCVLLNAALEYIIFKKCCLGIYKKLNVKKCCLGIYKKLNAAQEFKILRKKIEH